LGDQRSARFCADITGGGKAGKNKIISEKNFFYLFFPFFLV